MEDFEHRFVATYHDIVENERIVYSYELYVNGLKLFVSHTEYGAYLDGNDSPQKRRDGTNQLLDALGGAL